MSVRKYGRGLLQGALLSTLMYAGFAGATHAATFTCDVSNPCNIDVYRGTNPGGAIGDAMEQAQQGNPLIAPANLIGSGSYLGAINFFENGTSNQNGNTLTFLNSAGGTLGGTLPAITGGLSSSGFQLTTVMVITGNTAGSILFGSITHDDGVSLYDGPGYSNARINAPTPVSATASSYAGLSGAWEIVYVEANGLPAILDFEIARSEEIPPTPLPAAVWLFGTVLAGGVGMRKWRSRKQTRVSAA